MHSPETLYGPLIRFVSPFFSISILCPQKRCIFFPLLQSQGTAAAAPKTFQTTAHEICCMGSFKSIFIPFLSGSGKRLQYFTSFFSCCDTVSCSTSAENTLADEDDVVVAVVVVAWRPPSSAASKDAFLTQMHSKHQDDDGTGRCHPNTGGGAKKLDIAQSQEQRTSFMKV